MSSKVVRHAVPTIATHKNEPFVDQNRITIAYDHVVNVVHKTTMHIVACVGEVMRCVHDFFGKFPTIQSYWPYELCLKKASCKHVQRMPLVRH